MRTHPFLLALAVTMALPCSGAEMPRTERTGALIRELLEKLDSTDVYAARKEQKIERIKAGLPGDTDAARYDLYFEIAEEYSNYMLDSSLVYLEKAIRVARATGSDSLRVAAEIRRASILSIGGLYYEANETMSSIPRDALRESMYVSYYQSWALLFHELYSCSGEPADFREAYRAKYNIYRDSLLAVADPSSLLYLRNMEKKAARAGNYEEARRYNALRLARIEDPRSGAYATCLYDRFQIANYYERRPTGAAVDDLLESSIIEVLNCNYNIASLLRTEAYLFNINEIKAAKKVSDYYFSFLRKFGSRKRIVDGVAQTMIINDRNHQSLVRRNKEILAALVLISLLSLALVFMLLKINSSRLKITRLKDSLQRSGKISKGYVGVVFQLYSSYIKRLDVFRTKIHSSLRKGHIDQALELTSPLGNAVAEDRKVLFHNFDTAFVDIFPDFIQTVNACLRPDAGIVPKKTEILNTELRILALIKLGIEDSTQIAEMLQCSVKTVYNLRSGLKARLSVPEETFKKRISEL